MKNAVVGTWRSLGKTGKLIVTLTLFYFICKTFNK